MGGVEDKVGCIMTEKTSHLVSSDMSLVFDQVDYSLISFIWSFQLFNPIEFCLAIKLLCFLLECLIFLFDLTNFSSCIWPVLHWKGKEHLSVPQKVLSCLF